MIDDDILRAAIECQLLTTGNREGIYSEALMRFAKLVAAHEREACAKVADEYTKASYLGAVGAAIRARSNT